MNEEHLSQEIHVVCTRRWGFSDDIPQFAYTQAEAYIENRESGKRVGDLLIEANIFTAVELDQFEARKPKGMTLGAFICEELLNQNDEQRYTQVQRCICALKNEGVLFLDEFPNDYITPHLIITDGNKAQKKAAIAESESLGAIPVRIAGQTNAVLFSSIDKAKNFRDAYPRAKQAESVFYKELGEFKIVVCSPKHIRSFLEDNSDGSDASEEVSRVNTVTYLSLESKNEHRKLAAVWNSGIARKATDIKLIPSVNDKDTLVKVRFKMLGEWNDYTREFKISYSEYAVILGKLLNMTGSSVSSVQAIFTPLDLGRLRYVSSGKRHTTFRTNLLPLGHGEESGRQQKSVAFRLLPESSEASSFETLNVDEKIADSLRSLVQIKGQCVLFVGETGSGKSSLMMAAIDEYDKYHAGKNDIMSIEDPVETQKDNVTQVQVTKRAEDLFAKDGMTVWEGYLRSFVRQNPDCIILGEIRDGKTAAIAGQFAASGHELFTTYHAKTPEDAFKRIRDNFEDRAQLSTFVSALGVVVTCHLSKELCSCAVKRVPTKHEYSALLRQLDGVSDKYKSLITPETELAFQNHDGCKDCDKGVVREIPVNGVLFLTREHKRLLLSNDEAKIMDAFQVLNEGDYSMLEQKLDLIVNHTISLKEL